MTININNLRVSFIWIETNLELLKANAGTTFPLGFLGDSVAYKNKIHPLLNNEHNDDLSLPWINFNRNRFWYRYFNRKQPLANDAWMRLLPIRRNIRVIIEPEWGAQDPITIESLFYPFGFGLIITIYIREDSGLSLENAVNAAQTYYRNGFMSIKSASSTNLKLEENVLKNSTSKQKLQKIAVILMNALQLYALNKNLHAKRTLDPLTIVSVIQGEGINKNTPLKDQGSKDQIQRALEGLSNWQKNWDTVVLPSIDAPDIILDSMDKDASAGDIVYAGKGTINRGRVIWFPGKFQERKNVNTLGCYHRNMLMGMLHTECLLEFIDLVLATYPNGQYKYKSNMRQCLESACDILGDLHFGKRTTYRSGSIKTQIEQSGKLEEIISLGKSLK